MSINQSINQLHQVQYSSIIIIPVVVVRVLPIVSGKSSAHLLMITPTRIWLFLLVGKSRRTLVRPFVFMSRKKTCAWAPLFVGQQHDHSVETLYGNVYTVGSLGLLLLLLESTKRR